MGSEKSGNPKPNYSTRFGSGQPQGRKPGSRDRISVAFLTAVADDFEKYGIKTLEKVRRTDASTYIKVVASLMPKEIEIKQPLDGMKDDELLIAIETLTKALRGQLPEAKEEPAKTLQ
jgi:hypothetical protein